MPFGEDFVQYLFERRSALLSALFQLFNFLGDVEGYILIVALVYVAWDKQLAYRLALMAIGAMLANHVLKTLIANPRPFVTAGTWSEKWAVSPETAQRLLSEYSTPSGHAMSGAAFYGYLAAFVQTRWLQVAALVCILMTGLSRPYVGVHYLEDILLGWVIGGALAVLAYARGDQLGAWWGSLSGLRQTSLVVVTSVALWVGTRIAYAESTHGPPLAVLSYLGLLTGVVFAHPIERDRIGFDPRSGGWAIRLARFAVAVALVIGTLELLDWLFERVSADESLLGNALRFARYAAAACAGLLVGPYLFVRLGLAPRVTRG